MNCLASIVRGINATAKNLRPTGSDSRVGGASTYKGNSSMSGFKIYWGNVVLNQEMFNAKYSSLFGESPRSGDILSNCDLDGAVVFDGETWRELDLTAMQKSINRRQMRVPSAE